jgi:ssDNA-binding Zn-finger/Zn-ribbon topoisomerase 1
VEVVVHPPCPVCGRPTVLRTTERGRRAGTRFWGCTAFPRCRGTVDLTKEAEETWAMKLRRPLW